MEYLLISKKRLTEWIEETHGNPEENWCGLEGEEALKYSLYETTNKIQDRRRNVTGRENWKGVRQECPL